MSMFDAYPNNLYRITKLLLAAQHTWLRLPWVAESTRPQIYLGGYYILVTYNNMYSNITLHMVSIW